MNELPSAQFRTQYAKLTDQTMVTVNGHPIGVWTPTPALGTSPLPEAVRSTQVLSSEPMEVELHRERAKLPAGGLQARQAQRDALLSKINRGK